MDRRGISPEMLERLAAQASSLAESQALAAEADRLRGLAAVSQRPTFGIPILRN